MQRLGTWMGGVGMLAGVVALGLAAQTRADLDQVRSAAADTVQEVDAVDERSRDVRRAVDAVSAVVRGVRTVIEQNDLGALDGRVSALEDAVAELRSTTTAGAVVTPAEATGDAAELAAEFETLRRKVFAGEATDEESRRFWELARTSDAIDEMVAELSREVEQTPRDVPTRMRLASALVARLWSVPNGPERGMWAARAEAQWRAVIEVDESHWEARYSLGFSLSRWPDFMGKRGEAVKVFEDLRERQEAGAVAPHQRDTYLRLAELHQRQGSADKARDVLREGLERHPRDEALEKALAEIE